VNEIHARFADQGLVRPRDGRVLGGVIAGLGRRFGIDPWPARLLFVLILLVIPGSQILIYPLLWILMPSEETVMQTRRPAGAAGAAGPDDSLSHHPPRTARTRTVRAVRSIWLPSQPTHSAHSTQAA
jgi:phage shock protein PspC (stress-responsive transcriptional regulator)